MMLERQIEAKIIAAIEALGLTGLVVRGAWQSAAASGTKNAESAADAAILDVTVAPRSFDAFAHPAITLDVQTTLSIRADVYPDGGAIEAFAGPVLDLISSWNLALFAHGDDCGLGVENLFDPAGIQLMGGSAPDFDRNEGKWIIDINFTLKGVVLANFTTTTTTEQEAT